MAVKYPEYVNKLAVMGANAFAGPKAIDPAVIKIFENANVIKAIKEMFKDDHEINLTITSATDFD